MMVSVSDDPLSIFSDWYQAACETEPNDPNAMSLATTDVQGYPNVRMVLLKEFDQQGFVFFTNSESKKGQELAANPNAALCLHWKSQRRQVRMRGFVEFVSDAQSDAYFTSRHPQSRIGSWASQQSRPLGEYHDLETAFHDYTARYCDEDSIPRPAYWRGYRLLPLEIEFWQDQPYRLHKRWLYKRQTVKDNWQMGMLYP